MKKIAITGAGGQIAYSLVFRIAAGEFLGPKEQIALHLLDLPQGFEALKGLVMELEDCAFPLVREIRVGVDPVQVFEGVDYAFLIGAKPRGPGMERKDLLADNGKIFVEQGKALNRSAAKGARILVVGNPCNTNCLIAIHHAPDIPAKQFHAMTRLDHNRAIFQLAQKGEVPLEEVRRVTIWGNHSSTQVPDFIHAEIRKQPLLTALSDRSWLEGDFLSTVQKRGAAVIAARGKSSAGSAAHAALSAMRSLVLDTPQGDWFSSAEYTKGNPYGIDEDLVFSFPCRLVGGQVEIISGLKFDPFLQEKIAITQKELVEERDCVVHLLRG